MKPRARRLGAAARVAAGLLLAAAASRPAAALAATPTEGWRFKLRSLQHSDATALNLGHDPRAGDLAPRPGRNLAYIDDEVRAERQAAGWTVGLLARSRATLVASADTLALYQQVDSGEPISADRRWSVEARFRGFSGSGLVVGRAHDLGAGWSAHGQVQALVLQRWRERRISGSVGASLTRGEYDFALTSTQRDDRLRLPFQNANPSRGAALLGDLSVAWQGQRWKFEATVKDAGWLHWRALPRQDAVLDSRTSAFDADGFVIYRPLIQGQNTQPTATQAAAAWARLAAQGQPAATSSLTWDAGCDVLPGFGLLPWLGLRADVGASQLGLQWRTHERRLTLQWQWQGLALTAGADRLGAGSRSRELGLAWRLPF